MANPAYDSASCSSLDDFFDKFITFITSASLDAGNRFTEEMAVTSPQTLNTAGATSGGTTYPFKVRCVSRDSYNWYIRYHATGGVYGMPAPTVSTNSWNSLPGKPTDDCRITPVQGAGTYHFFAVDKVVHAVCVLNNGNHIHMNMGTLNKVGSWTGGEFFTGSYQDTSNVLYTEGTPTAAQHRFMFDGLTNQAAQQSGIMRCVYNSKNFAAMDYNDSSVKTGYNNVGGVGHLRLPADNAGSTQCANPLFTPNIYTPHNSPGVPVEYQLLREADDNLWYDLGTVPGIRFINVQYLDPGQALNDDWIAFPLSIKGVIGSVGNYASSADYGVAYYKGP